VPDLTTGPVELRIPASSAYLSLARAATASTCARLDFPLERLEDVTLAVDEAVALLLLDAVADQPLICRWWSMPGAIRVEISASSSSGRPPRTTTFAWTVLSALVDEANATIDGDQVTLSLTAQREQVTAS
jgi:serine/threonine-protein kinase RsbW